MFMWTKPSTPRYARYTVLLIVASDGAPVAPGALICTGVVKLGAPATVVSWLSHSRPSASIDTTRIEPLLIIVTASRPPSACSGVGTAGLHVPQVGALAAQSIVVSSIHATSVLCHST